MTKCLVRGENGIEGYKIIPVDNSIQLVWLCDTNLKLWLLVVMVMLTCMLLGLVATVRHKPNPCYRDDTDTSKAGLLRELIFIGLMANYKCGALVCN